jgi:hypothetical protein
VGKDRENFTRSAESPLRSVPPRYLQPRKITLRRIVDSKREFSKGTPRFQSIAGRACRVHRFRSCEAVDPEQCGFALHARIRRWPDEDLHEISHRYHRATAGTYDIQLSRSIPSGMWSLLTRSARTHARILRYFHHANSEVQLQKQKANAKCKMRSPHPFPRFGTKSARSVDYHTPPDPRVHPLRILLFFYEQKIKIKNAHAIPRNMAISKSGSESSPSTPMGRYGSI